MRSYISTLSTKARQIYNNALKEKLISDTFLRPPTCNRFKAEHGYYHRDTFEDELSHYIEALKLHIASVLHYDELICQNAQLFLRHEGLPPSWASGNLETNASCEGWLKKHEIEALYCYWKLDKHDMVKALCRSDNKQVRLLAKKLSLSPPNMLKDDDEDIRIRGLEVFASPKDIPKLEALRASETSDRVKRFVDRRITDINFRKTAWENLKKKLASN